MKAGTRAAVSLEIDASADTLYDLIADVTNMGRWSPECRSCEWIDGAGRAHLDARFKGTNRRGLARWTTTATVVVADPGREFAFVTGHRGHEMTRWGYRFEPGSPNTTVTESFEMLRDMPRYLKWADRVLMSVTDRQGDLETAMAQTLATLKTTSEHNSSTR